MPRRSAAGVMVSRRGDVAPAARETRCSTAHPCDAGRGLFEYLDQLSIDRLVYVEAKSGEVAAGSCQALGVATLHWISERRLHNRDSRSRGQERGSRPLTRCKDHIGAEAHPLRREGSKLLGFALGEMWFNGDILTLHISKFAKPLRNSRKRALRGSRPTISATGVLSKRIPMR
jgi:hypothetical protein